MAATIGARRVSGEDRQGDIRDFLAQAGWGGAIRQPIPGDASFRRYERLVGEGSQAILMDAPPERENTASFVNVQRYLLEVGLRAPRLIEGDVARGLLLLEDFGDVSVSAALRENPAEEATIYRDAVGVLAEMHGHALTRVAGSGSRFEAYDAERLLPELELLPQWFLPELLPADRVEEASAAFRAVWRGLLAEADLAPQVVVHRDYHADNLFLLPGEGTARIGLLDFQDALAGRPAYDLVSLLADARRDVSPEVVAASLDHYLARTGIDRQKLLAEFAFYGAQRNAKILGIFTRLFRRDGKPRYLDFVPRVFRLFDASLEHPSLMALKEWRTHYLPDHVVAALPGLRARLAEQ